MVNKFKVGDIVEYEESYYKIVTAGFDYYALINVLGIGISILNGLCWHIGWINSNCSLAPESVRLLYGD